MTRTLLTSLTLWLSTYTGMVHCASIDLTLSRSIVKIVAISADGKRNLGSGVVIDNNKIATNCHVTRSSNRAFLLKEHRRFTVLAQAAVPELDVCILKTAPLPLPIANLANDETKTGDDIAIFGYPYALNISMLGGKVVGLHDFQQDKIIEIDTGFNHGASGGGVFNSRGELVGMITFIGKHNQRKHFYAVPANWLTLAMQTKFSPMASFATRSFWEKGDFVHMD